MTPEVDVSKHSEADRGFDAARAQAAGEPVEVLAPVEIGIDAHQFGPAARQFVEVRDIVGMRAH